MSEQKLYFRTWALAIVLGIAIAIPMAIVMRWGIGTPELLVVNIGSILLVGLLIGIWRSKGKFRLHSILVVMVLVGVVSATVGRKFKQIQDLRAFAREIQEHGGDVELGGGSHTTHDGWMLTHGGWAIPEWFRPVYDYFTNTRVSSLGIPADLLTIQNLEACRLDGSLYRACVILQGSHRDSAALLELCNHFDRPYMHFVSNNLSKKDVEYMAVVAGKKRVHLTLNSCNVQDLQLLRGEQIGWLEIWGLNVLQDVEIAGDTLAKVRNLVDRNGNATPEMFYKWGAQNLDSLGIYGSSAMPKSLEALEHFTELNSISLHFRTYKISDDDFLKISRIESLERVSLFNSVATDQGLRSLANLRNLVELELLGSKCTFEGLQDLCRIVPLRRLRSDIAKKTDLSIPTSYELLGEQIRESTLGTSSQ